MLNQRGIPDVHEVEAGANIPVGIVAIFDLDERVFAPRILGQEDLPVAIEADDQQDMGADRVAFMEDVGDDFVFGQQRVLDGGYAGIRAKRGPIGRSIASVEARAQWNVLLAEIEFIDSVLRSVLTEAWEKIVRH